MEWEQVQGALRRRGVHVERCDASVTRQILASGLGGIAGQAFAQASRFGPLGVAISALGGSLLGHFAVTHRVHLDPARDRDPGPESPMAYSDRR